MNHGQRNGGVRAKREAGKYRDRVRPTETDFECVFTVGNNDPTDVTDDELWIALNDRITAVTFLKSLYRILPDSAKERASPYSDKTFKEWWAWIATLGTDDSDIDDDLENEPNVLQKPVVKEPTREPEPAPKKGFFRRMFGG